MGTLSALARCQLALSSISAICLYPLGFTACTNSYSTKLVSYVLTVGRIRKKLHPPAGCTNFAITELSGAGIQIGLFVKKNDKNQDLMHMVVSTLTRYGLWVPRRVNLFLP